MDLQKPLARANVNILDIPNELLLDVGHYLSIKDLASARKACHRLSRLLAQRHYKLGLKQDIGELTALQWAAERGHASLAEQAILSGAKIDEPNEKRSGRTSLHSAAKNNHPDVIRVLLKHGARISALDSDRRTPLHYAAMCKGAEGAMVLLGEGADMMCEDEFGDSPPFLAARKGGVPCMEAFIAAGFDHDTRERDGQTILHAAAFGRRAMLRYLLEQKEVKMAVNVEDSKGATPLHYVRNAGNIRLLLDNGAEMMVWDRHRDTPAHYAASTDNVSCLKAFVEAGFDIHTRGYHGRTVLHTATFHRSTSTMEYLLGEGDGEAILNAKDSRGETSLADALTSDLGSYWVIKVLLKYGADQEVKDGDGIRLADKIGKKRYYETDPEYETDSDYANESGDEVQYRIRSRY